MGGFVPDPAEVAGRIVRLEARPLRIAVDGVDCSGKSTFADLLAGRVGALGRQVIRAEGDAFLLPRAQRHRRAYQGSVDYQALRERLLEPLGPGGDRAYRTGVRDAATDRPIDAPSATAAEDAVLIVDGVFLQRREIRDCWDVVVWIDVPFQEALRRALLRDAERFGGREKARARYLERYWPGQRRYLEECHPGESANVVVTTG